MRKKTDQQRAESSERTVTRRGALSASVAASLTGMVTSKPAQAAAPGTEEVSVRKDGTYEQVPLVKDNVDYACVQHPVLPVDPKNPRPGIAANLKRMVTLIDEHAHLGPEPQTYCLFTNFRSLATRAGPGKKCYPSQLRFQVKKTEVLAAKAREYGIWLNVRLLWARSRMAKSCLNARCANESQRGNRRQALEGQRGPWPQPRF